MRPKEIKNWIFNKYKILKKTIRKPNFWIITLLIIIALSLTRPTIRTYSESWNEDKECSRQIENPEIMKFWNEYKFECQKAQVYLSMRTLEEMRIERLEEENCIKRVKEKISQEKNIPEMIDEKYICSQHIGTKRITKLVLFSTNRPIYLTIFVSNIREQ